jgi:hypothetical protein
MTPRQIRAFPVKTLCEEISKVLTVKEIKDQIRRFSKKLVSLHEEDCPLCMHYMYIDCEGCPYKRFENKGIGGCVLYSKVCYDGFDEGVFNPKARIAALARYKRALKIKGASYG